MSFLEIRNLHKSYPDGWTLDGVSFALEEGEILSLLGPSGCGKTTLLRLIAGLEMPEAGQILVHGVDMAHTPAHLRGFGLMFQEYALFPHKDVYGNVAFGLRMTGEGREAVADRVAETLELVGLAGFERRDVGQISGGERQRVALARSLAPQPRLLMLDEPLGALDRALRERLLHELPAILKRIGVTTIAVTHDQEEAFAIADRVILMRDGRIVQEGSPEAVYRQPASAWAARFLGLTNLIDGQIVEGGRVETALGSLQATGGGTGQQDSAAVTVLVRPGAARLERTGPNAVHGVVTDQAFFGSCYRLSVALADGSRMVFEWPVGERLPNVGEQITLSLDPGELILLPAVAE